MNVRKIDNALLKTSAASMTLTATAIHTAVLTRWSAILTDGRTVVVDVYETRAATANPWCE